MTSTDDERIIKIMTSNLHFIHKFADFCFQAHPEEVDSDDEDHVIWEALPADWDCTDDEAYDYFMECGGFKHFSSDWLFDNDKDRERALYLLVEEEEALMQLMIIINKYRKTRCKTNEEYIGEPGCLNYLFGIPLAKGIIVD
jgi:hypothetical protein